MYVQMSTHTPISDTDSWQPTIDGGGLMPAAGAQRGIISYGAINLRVLAAAEGA
jgi:hypothetical protein